MDIAIIHWNDAWIDNIDLDIEQAKMQKSVKRSTCGYLVSENDEGVLLATDVYEGGKQVYSPMFIPWGMISIQYTVELMQYLANKVP